jgi:hypothetical protein
MFLIYFNYKFYRCERDLVEKQKHCMLYSSLYNKTEYNLMMADMETATCSCLDKLCEPFLSNIHIKSYV